MKLSTLAPFCLSIGLIWVLGCNPAQAPTPTASATPIPSPSPGFQPDPCNPANIPTTIKPLNNLMRQFDDYAELASNVMQSELVKVIPVLQAIRRTTEDEAVPSCLAHLKSYALIYMDTTIQALLSFQSNASAGAIATGIAKTRQYHDMYTQEAADLLGVTLAAPSTAPAAATTPTP